MDSYVECRYCGHRSPSLAEHDTHLGEVHPEVAARRRALRIRIVPLSEVAECRTNRLDAEHYIPQHKEDRGHFFGWCSAVRLSAMQRVGEW